MRSSGVSGQLTLAWLGVACVGMVVAAQSSAQELKPGVALAGDVNEARSVAFSPDGKTLAAGGALGFAGGPGRTIKLWDVASGKEQAPFTERDAEVYCVAFSPDGSSLASGCKDGKITLWDVSTGKEKGTLKGHTGLVASLAFSPDGKVLASGGGIEVKLWDVAKQKESTTIRGVATDLGDSGPFVAIAPDGKTLAVAWSSGKVKLFDVAKGKEKATLHVPSGVLQGKGQYFRPISSVAFSPDGKTLAVGGFTIYVVVGASGGQKIESPPKSVVVKLFDVAKGKEKAALSARNPTTSEGKVIAGTSVWAVAFSPDGKSLAAGVWDGPIAMWDVATGKQQAPAKDGHGLKGYSVVFSPDGKTLAVVSMTSTPRKGENAAIKLWSVSSDKEGDK